MIGFKRDVEAKWLLFFSNVVLGATGVVWIACFAYACFGPKMETLSVNKTLDAHPIDAIENLFVLHTRKM
jgi:Superinfection immunity protein